MRRQSMNELLFETIESVGNAIKNKHLSPVELTQITLNQIRELQPRFNAFITVMEEETMAQAKQLEAELHNNHVRGPLHGIPIAVKDILQTKGVKTTGGSKIFEGWIPNEDAAPVKKLRK